MPFHIVVVDDDVDVARTIELSLRRHTDFRVSLAFSGAEALQAIRRHRPDLVILDIIMPGMDGYEVCSQLRADPLCADIPILFLSAKGEISDRLEGFRLGADDYLTKPFNVEELAQRAKAVLRRTHADRSTPAEPPTILTVGDLALNTKTFQVSSGDHQRVLLTPVEFDLLYHLMSNAGTVFSSEKLLQEVWGYPYDAGSPDLVRMHVRNLRLKIEPNPQAPVYIRTVPRRGYTVNLPEGSDTA